MFIVLAFFFCCCSFLLCCFVVVVVDTATAVSVLLVFTYFSLSRNVKDGTLECKNMASSNSAHTFSKHALCSFPHGPQCPFTRNVNIRDYYNANRTPN